MTASLQAVMKLQSWTEQKEISKTPRSPEIKDGVGRGLSSFSSRGCLDVPTVLHEGQT